MVQSADNLQLKDKQAKNWLSLMLAVILLLPAFPALLTFLLRGSLANRRSVKKTGERDLWLVTIFLSLFSGFFQPPILWIVLLFRNEYVVKFPVTLAVMLPVLCSGISAGILYEKRRKVKWLAAVPIALVNVFFIMVYWILFSAS